MCTDRWKRSSSSKTTKKCFLLEFSLLPTLYGCVQRDSASFLSGGQGRECDLGLSLVFI